MQDAHEESKAVTKAAAMKGNLFPVGFLLILYKFTPMSTYSFCCLCSFLGDLWLCFIKTRIYNYGNWLSLLMLHKNKDMHVKNLQRKVARTKVGNIFCNHDMPRFLMLIFFIVCHFSLESAFQCQSCGTQLITDIVSLKTLGRMNSTSMRVHLFEEMLKFETALKRVVPFCSRVM